VTPVYCRNHPDREADVLCQKNGTRGYCRECLDEGVPCFDPDIYCKFRTQCIIWALAREHGLHHKGEMDAAAPSS
jgi:hypothetical protein